MAAALSIELLVNIDASPLKMAECCRPDETGSRREANGCSALRRRGFVFRGPTSTFWHEIVTAGGDPRANKKNGV